MSLAYGTLGYDIRSICLGRVDRTRSVADANFG